MPKCKFRKSVWVLMAVAVLAVAPTYSWWVFSRRGPLTQDASVLIKKGTTISQAVELLVDSGVIENKRLFMLWARINGIKIIRGEYIFPAKSSMAEVLEKITKGAIHTTKLVITPALHGWSVQKRLEPFISEDKFWSMWENPEFIRRTGFPDAPSLEGLIAPATYNLNLAMEPEEIMLEMVQSFHAQVFPMLEGGVLSPYQTLILASLAEKETNVPEELPKITGVFINRLKSRMKLQCDPTSLYARWLSGDLRFTPPTREDINRSHPYNTYSAMGLPPSPIAIPSKAAIEAAKSPSETQYLFFVATGTGGHNFSRTLKEHNQFVNTYRNEINKQRRARQATESY